MSLAKHSSADNQLLAALPKKDRQRFLGNCDSVNLAFSEVLAEHGKRIRYVYFPLESFISLVARLDEHPCLEVGLIGNEGMLGVSLILGLDKAPLHAMVQGEGSALRMSAAQFQRELELSPNLLPVLKRYLYVELVQFAQASACTRFHVLEARLARWLLMTHDRAHTDIFHVTQEFLSYMLGVRRVGVTKAASALQNQKLIHYSRGNMTILDRVGLEAASCGCYKGDKAIYTQVMG